MPSPSWITRLLGRGDQGKSAAQSAKVNLSQPQIQRFLDYFNLVPQQVSDGTVYLAPNPAYWRGADNEDDFWGFWQAEGFVQEEERRNEMRKARHRYYEFMDF